MDRDSLVAYIRQAAISRGMDPDIAVRVAEAEGLNANPEEGWQSNFVKDGKRERSYGPFQLYVDGGLGNVFKERTGLDPSDPTTVFKQIDFALDEANRGGWSPWMGAKAAGIGPRDGLSDGTPGAAEELNNKSYDMFGDEYKTPEARNAAEELILSTPNKQAANKSFLDELSDSMAYLDASQLGKGAGSSKVRDKDRDLGARITPGRAGSGGRALKRLGIASLV